jgi:hypothetical protein
MDRETILTEALAGRDAEVMHYQINIDNYTRAIARIDAMRGADKNMLDFRARLADLLASEQREQARAVLLRDVISEQVDEIAEAKAIV